VGGKTATSTQQVSVPPEVLAQYNSVNSRANNVANTPFQQYGGEFVAPINATQNAGIAGTNTYANTAQPYFGAATDQINSSQSAVNPINQAAISGTEASSAPLTGDQINQYLSPYLSTVLGSTSALIGQQNEQAQAGQLGDAIRSGAFGGDRTGIAAANLNQQQNLASANILSGIANQGYQSALSTAQGQQQIGLAGANQLAQIGSTAYGEGANTANTLANLGTGAQSAGLAGANAQIQAGTVQQQTQQAQDTAQYQQFLQQQSYPFQVAQFLANIAEGTGALSGSTTTTQQPGGFFSDERLKEDMEPIGKTFDGQPIYRYKMAGDSRERIGLSAQEVEKKHPDAVGLAGGFKWVDYGRATDAAANRAHFYEGGVVPFPRKRFADGGGLDGVLEAQQRMYAPQSGGGQRNIPSQGTSHQLAVAPGVPAPPPSGESKVSQTIGLGKDAYSAYKYFNKPTPGATGAQPMAGSSYGGLSPAGAQPSGAISYGAGSPSAAAGASPASGLAGSAGTQSSSIAPLISELPAGSSGSGLANFGADTTASTVAPAATGAATDAAAAGATDAAASAATGAAAGAGAEAAAGAATGAVAAGAADAAATEAAALAAEYAATYAAMAAVAAKRGGRIKRPGLAAGGSPYVDPYADPDGGLVIPDQEVSGAHLQSPGALVKQPTGLQTAMKMGDINQAPTMMGAVFSNTAAARGGLIGHHHHYDEGGYVPNDDPETVTVNSPEESAAPSEPEKSTGVAGGSKDHWWKHSENIIPILSGLAAMGTAKTRSPGVALAEGLGAGTQSYLSTRASQAKTEEVRQKAKGEDISNQLAALKLKTAQQNLGDQGAPNTPTADTPYSVSPMPTTQGAADAADKMDAWARGNFGPPTQYTPKEQQDIKQGYNAAFATGDDSFLKRAQAAREQRIANETQQRQQFARHTAASLYAKATDPASTQDQRDSAQIAYNAVFQHTGHKIGDAEGQRIVAETGAPTIGVAAQGANPAQRQAAYSEAMDPVTLGNGLPGFRYQLAGKSSPEEYVASKTGVAQQGQPGAPTSAAPRRTPVSAAPPRSAAAPAQATPAASTGDKYLDSALSDTSYRQAPLPRVTDQLNREAAQKQQAINIANRSALLKESEAATNAGSTAMQYLKAAKSIMDSKGATVGAYGGLLTSASRWMGGGPQSTNYQELAKYLGNAAAQQAQANFPNATQSEVHMQFNELSPNVQMDDSTIKKLLNTNIRSTDYALKSANRVKSYLDSGNDPQNFSKWNQKYYDREKVVNSQTATGPNGEKLYLVNGKWVP
jgi:hypothetical protein